MTEATPLRVGFLIDRWEPRRGGAERALAHLARHLAARGHEVLAFAVRADPDAPGEFRPVSAGPLLGGLRRAGFERDLGHALAAAARAAECDVTIGLRHLPAVDVYWPHGGAHRRSLLARHRAAGQEGNAPVPTGRHLVFLDFEARLLAAGGARRVVCVSDLVRRELIEEYPACADRLVVVPNGVDLDAFHPRHRAGAGMRLRGELGVADSDVLLAFAARAPELKGLPALLRALVGLGSRPWKLLVAGLRHPRRWRREAARVGLPAERVHVHEDLPAPAMFTAADLTVLPTWRDTASLVVLESLASGTPVITSHLAGAATYVQDPEAGTVLSDPGDVAGLRAALDDWCARLATGPSARDTVRAAVSHLGIAPWLATLERIVVEAAER